jgi:hypothetical protein
VRKKIGSQYNEKKLSEVAQRIKARRIALGYSYQDLADLTSMSKSTLQRYETGGIANLPVDKIDCIAIALKTTSEYLMGWKNASELSDSVSEELKNLSELMRQCTDNLLLTEINNLLKNISYFLDLDERQKKHDYLKLDTISAFTSAILQLSTTSHFIQRARNEIEQNIAKIHDILNDRNYQKFEHLTNLFLDNSKAGPPKHPQKSKGPLG